MTQETSKTRGQLLASNAAVSVPQSGNTELLDLDVTGISELGIEIVVTVQALDTFIIQGRMSKDSAYQTLYSTSGDFTVPTGLLIGTSGDLTVQAAGTTGWAILSVRPLYSVKILASSGNVAGSTVTAYAIGKY